MVESAPGTRPAPRPNQSARLLLVLFLPLAAFILQSLFWTAIKPFAWFLFFPAVFLSAWVGGMRGGIIATVISTALAWWFFLPPEHSFALENPAQLGSIALFVIMGILFGYSQERVTTANRRTTEALALAHAANDRLQDANAKITALYEKTRELDELKTHFFANISHELRTPLALILGPVARRLAVCGLSDEARQDLEVIDRNARLLHRHVSDLLDVAKLEAGRMPLHYVACDLAALVRLTASHFEVLAQEKRIGFSVDVPGKLLAQIDAEKCRRIVLNLLSNAFKFSPEGGTIVVSLLAAEHRAVILVRDNGPGVPEAMREIIFERFRQVEEGAARRFGGTGLGLAIVREFVVLQGGSVKVNQAPGGGAVFCVTLPLTAPAGVAVGPLADASGDVLDRQAVEELRDRRAVPSVSSILPTAPLVLVVEDNADMNAFLAGTLGRSYRVATAFDGSEGREKALALRPDLILTDVMMPVMSGGQMIEALRRNPQMNEVPIVVLTAKADDDLRVRLLQEGAQDCLCKPFSAEELLARVGGLLATRRRAGERVAKVLETMGEAFISIDREWRYTYINAAAEQNLRHPRAELIGRDMREMFPEGGEFFAHYARALAENTPAFFDACFKPYDVWVNVRAYPSADGLAIFYTDITDRKRAEAELQRLNIELEGRVAARTAELHATNRELESFAYAVSHDLRAPLRAMRGFSQALIEDYGGQLDVEAREFLNQIIAASRRMGELIDGLLALSRSSRGELRRERVDLSAMAERLLTELAEADPDRHVRRRIEPGLIACGDAAMIEVVLRNLLDNAWKYSARAAAPEIRVYAGEKNGVRGFCVADNGAGFEMSYAGKLFQPFQRLHRQDEFPGIGIGLATVKRIVNRHGGEIQAFGAPGQGAEFHFTLPSGGGETGGQR